MLCLAEPVGDMPGGCSYLLSCVNSEEERGKLSSLSLKAKSSVAAGRQPAAELGVPARGHLQSAAREQEASKASQRACGAAVWSELFPPPSALGGQAGLGGGGGLGCRRSLPRVGEHRGAAGWGKLSAPSLREVGWGGSPLVPWPCAMRKAEWAQSGSPDWHCLPPGGKSLPWGFKGSVAGTNRGDSGAVKAIPALL